MEVSEMPVQSLDLPLSDLLGWNDPTNYSTIQTAVVNNELYLLARANAGMETYRLNPATDRWSLLAGASPKWSDADGWNDPANYSTIQTAVVKNELFLLARANAGMLTYKFNAATNRWSLLVAGSPAWSDTLGWNDPASYSTIHAVVLNDELYLAALCPQAEYETTGKLELYKFSPESNRWLPLTDERGWPNDMTGWNDHSVYSTLQITAVESEIMVIARLPFSGIDVLRFHVNSGHWCRTAGPRWTDQSGWNDPANYSTIQTAAVNNELFLLARANAGMLTYKLDPLTNAWSEIATGFPVWCDVSNWEPSNYSTNWKEAAHYSTIRTAVVSNQLYLLGRAWSGMMTYRFSAEERKWSLQAGGLPEWSDSSGWNDPTNYSTIQTAVVNNELYLLARANAGLITYRFNATQKWWHRAGIGTPP